MPNRIFVVQLRENDEEWAIDPCAPLFGYAESAQDFRAYCKAKIPGIGANPVNNDRGDDDRRAVSELIT
jgi:hypothetical protein